MVFTKERVYKNLVFVFFILFPFGQLFRISLEIFARNIYLHPVDLVAILILLIWFFERSKKPKIYPWIVAFVVTFSFSLIFSLTIFQLKEITIGLMYLLRVFAYISVFLLTWDILNTNKSLKSQLYNFLIAVSVFSAIGGWIQYFLYPDLRALEAYGWDDHYYRLIGTLLDPGFTSIILVFGLILTLCKYLIKTDKKLISLSVFFLATIAFTYSRAGYLATLAGLFTLFYMKGRMKVIFAFLAVFFLFILLLPREPGGEGVNLRRTASIFERVANYQETFKIFKTAPVFGVGFNNLCAYREKYLSYVSTDSHSCSGADSSLLFILATTGILGLFVIVGLGLVVVKSISPGLYGLAFLTCTLAVILHSFFHNTIFYPWVMGYLALLGGVALKKK